jgi:hypothetical protein
MNAVFTVIEDSTVDSHTLYAVMTRTARLSVPITRTSDHRPIPSSLPSTDVRPAHFPLTAVSVPPGWKAELNVLLDAESFIFAWPQCFRKMFRHLLLVSTFDQSKHVSERPAMEAFISFKLSKSAEFCVARHVVAPCFPLVRWRPLFAQMWLFPIVRVFRS